MAIQDAASVGSAAVTPDAIMQLGTAYWGSKTLLSAVELKLFGVLSESGPLTVDELQDRLGLHPRSARDFVDALVALRMLNRDDGRYSNTVETGLYLDPAKPTYVGGMLEMGSTRLYGFWGSLTEALLTGQAQSEVKTGGSFFETVYSDPDKLAGFTAAMSGLSRAAGEAIAAKFPWHHYGSMIDIGCAQGAVPVAIAQAHDHVTGGGFDLPQVEPIFNSYVAKCGLSECLTFTAGDFFADPLPSADVLIMGHILHDWGMDQKRQLLQKAFEALPTGGALIVHEALIDDDRRENAFGLLMSLNMLIEGLGFDFTGADCQGWMAEIGFTRSYVEPLAGPDSMVVGIK
ncbi:Tetracenomycin polyketide synthesis 8-O-methyl transferase TcmO [uncultured Mycobacterium sp.]|uniref:Tetracenomycin polyketide synthesis 8-O-methyl transferase TcmO n=1 Tax=uncultured Mycobacterium sp. TaxID=171292 RepID=A0A1Y5PU14_9MYCO|nr:Tetracenomycin polyketide synthesis 8-O-methyl transferase TcmO [uncultured Mycobacterium sp.]